MIEYDRSQALIFIHVPKAAGTTTKRVFKTWFGDNLLEHYFNERTGQMPQRYDLDRLHNADHPVVVYGHFNRLRGFGVRDYYPDVNQFVTILRDPYEMMLSHYFYTRKKGANWKSRAQVPDKRLADYLLDTTPNMLNHFPRPVTLANYKEVIDKYFIDIGFTDQLSESLERMARKLGKPFDEKDLDHLNVSEKDEEVSDQLRDKFIERNELEYMVYDYAFSRFAQDHESS